MSIPQLRSSQVVTTFGPGSMVDLPDASVLIAGLDSWKYDNARTPLIREGRLSAKIAQVLGRATVALRPPPASVDQPHGFQPAIDVWQFPQWFIVQLPEPVRPNVRSRRLVHLNDLERGRYQHPRTGDRHPVVPVRFVRACPAGHLGEIQWSAFVHGSSPCGRDLWIDETGTIGDLDSVSIRCGCGLHRPMSDAANRIMCALGDCDGSRPWLGPSSRENCTEKSRLLVRSASNAYFPQLMSVISIPDTRRPIDEAVAALWDDFLSDVTAIADLAKLRKKPSVFAGLSGMDDADVYASIERRKGAGGGDDRKIKEVEFEALSEARDELGSDVPNGDFYARGVPKKYWEAKWTSGIERVVLVHRLREVIAQLGFTRFEAAGPDIQGELSFEVKRANLALDAQWLPAIENRGEGIFIQFDSERVRDWTTNDAVKARGLQLVAGFDRWKQDHPDSKREFPHIPYYMLHTFSHLLITAISLECGYPSSSLRERVYASDGNYGVLIYTGSSDAEGTLGGLVEAGRNIRRHILRALELGSLCSNDPVCAFHRPAEFDHQHLLGGACHGCALISETCCEQQNDFLDRALVVPTVEHLGAEFFRGAV
jgi:hypothetical protein